MPNACVPFAGADDNLSIRPPGLIRTATVPGGSVRLLLAARWGALIKKAEMRRFNIPITCALLLLALSSGLASADLPGCDACWSNETVVHGDARADWCDIVLDELNRPHIAYYSDSLNALVHAVRGESGWEHNTVTGLTLVSSVLSAISMAIDGTETLHISFVDQVEGVFVQMYAIGSGSSWTIEEVGTGGDGSLALDASGAPHIAYSGPVGPLANRLKYSRRVAGLWTIEPVDSTVAGTSSISGLWPSLSLDASGNPHIGFSSSLGNTKDYAWKAGGRWHIEKIESAPGGNLSRPALALDPGGSPHMSYNKLYSSTNSLRYARRIGSAWSFENFGSSANPDLVLDSGGRAIVAFGLNQLGPAGQACAFRTVDGWLSEAVWPERSGGLFRTAIALGSDAGETPHCLFRSGDNLVYAARNQAVTSTGDEPVPFTSPVLSAFPNPLRIRTSLGFSMPGAGEARLTLYDVWGRLIATLVDRNLEPGEHRVVWDGRDFRGEMVPNGIYFARLARGSSTAQVKLILAR